MVGFAMPTNLSPFIPASLAQERIGGPHERGPGRVSQLPWRKSGSGDLTNEARAEDPIPVPGAFVEVAGCRGFPGPRCRGAVALVGADPLDRVADCGAPRPAADPLDRDPASGDSLGAADPLDPVRASRALAERFGVLRDPLDPVRASRASAERLG